jgi:hypothetical protein
MKTPTSSLRWGLAMMESSMPTLAPNAYVSAIGIVAKRRQSFRRLGNEPAINANLKYLMFGFLKISIVPIPIVP